MAEETSGVSAKHGCVRALRQGYSMDRLFSRLLWLPDITDQPVTVGELMSIVAAVVGGLVVITAMWHVIGIVIERMY